MIWLEFLVNVAASGGFALVAIMRAKRIGGVAPWLLALAGAADGGLFILFRFYALLSNPLDSYGRMRTFSMLQLFDGVVMYGLGVLVLVAFYLLMPPTRRA